MAKPGPLTKAQRLRQLTEAWAQLAPEKTGDLDLRRATLLAEALQTATPEGALTTRDLAAATGISKRSVNYLVRYHRFRIWCEEHSVVSSTVDTLPERRFRAYDTVLRDPSEPRTRTTAIRDAQEGRLFSVICTFLREGKPPPVFRKATKPLTVEQMQASRDPVRTLAREVHRLYTTEFKTVAADLQRLLHSEHVRWTPGELANAAISLERWQTQLETLLQDFMQCAPRTEKKG